MEVFCHAIFVCKMCGTFFCHAILYVIFYGLDHGSFLSCYSVSKYMCRVLLSCYSGW
jgi:hypothetical protein